MHMGLEHFDQYWNAMKPAADYTRLALLVKLLSLLNETFARGSAYHRMQVVIILLDLGKARIDQVHACQIPRFQFFLQICGCRNKQTSHIGEHGWE